MTRPEVSLPHPITFFLTRQERAELLKVLRRHDVDRSRALLVALKITAKDAQ